MLSKVNVAQCETQPLYERGKFQTTYRDLTEPLGACVIGATVFEIKAGFTRGPYHFHDGVEEWMYVVSGEPVLPDPSGKRSLQPGTLVAFQAGPDGAHTVDGPGRIVMFSVGARGWGEAFTSVYLDANKIGGKPGVQFLRAAALEIWAEPAAVPVPSARTGPCAQVDLRSVQRGGSHLAQRLHAQTWAPILYELVSSETTGPYHYYWCRERWALVVGGAPTLRHPDGQDVMAPGDIVCFPEGEAGAHQFVNHADEPARLLVCSAPVSGPSAAVYPDENTYVLSVPGKRDIASASPTSSATTGTVNPGPPARSGPHSFAAGCGPAHFTPQPHTRALLHESGASRPAASAASPASALRLRAPRPAVVSRRLCRRRSSYARWRARVTRLRLYQQSAARLTGGCFAGRAEDQRA